MLKLKLQYFGHLIWKTDSIEKTVMLGRIKGRRRRGRDGWMASPPQWTWVWASSRRRWRTGEPVCCSPWGHRESDATEWLNWTEHHSVILATNIPYLLPILAVSWKSCSAFKASQSRYEVSDDLGKTWCWPDSHRQGWTLNHANFPEVSSLFGPSQHSLLSACDKTSLKF